MNYVGPVKIAAPEDEEEIMELCRQLHEENAMFAMNDAKVRAMLRRAFDRQGGILGKIGETSIEGVVYLSMGTAWYSDDPYLEEVFLYVRPECRRSKNAIMLMQFAKWCADSANISLLIGVLSTQRTQGKVRLYQREFSQPAGNFFLYNGNATPH